MKIIALYLPGIEIRYDLYSPLVLKIEVLKLEKRLDDELFYLRDAPAEYSTFPFNMEAVTLPPNAPVPVNQIKVTSVCLIVSAKNCINFNRNFERYSLRYLSSFYMFMLLHREPQKL